jgi:hypothetical protein
MIKPLLSRSLYSLAVRTEYGLWGAAFCSFDKDDCNAKLTLYRRAQHRLCDLRIIRTGMFNSDIDAALAVMNGGGQKLAA